MSVSVTIWRDDGDTELDVTATPTDWPDATTGITEQGFELSAAVPLSESEQDRALAAARRATEGMGRDE